MNRCLGIASVVLLVMMTSSCKDQKHSAALDLQPTAFNPDTMKIPDTGVRKIRGQVLYMPVYSNIPYGEKEHYGLSAFLAIHNTDMHHPINLNKVMLFDTTGRAVRTFLTSDRQLAPFATAIFTTQQKDPSGTGANFLVEWTADQPVNEPLAESVMKDVYGDRGVSFLSTGRVIRELQ